MSEHCVRIAVSEQWDVTRAVLEANSVCVQVGFRVELQRRVATAVAELATNILKYAKTGEVYFRVLDEAGRRGIQITAQDRGPGMDDPEPLRSVSGPQRGRSAAAPALRRQGRAVLAPRSGVQQTKHLAVTKGGFVFDPEALRPERNRSGDFVLWGAGVDHAK